jgi:hypothetical protein
MKNHRSRLLMALVAAFFSAALFARPAEAGLIGTSRAIAPPHSDRDRVKALVARPEVAQKLATLGVPPKDAQARIDALTDEEVSALAARIDALPAGGLATQEWLLIIIAVLLLVIAL